MQLYGIQSTAMRYFLEVVRCGSIAEASQKLNVAASAVSRQISKLEGQIGVPLLERRQRGVVANPAGERLAEHARRSQLDAEEILSEIQGLSGLKTGLVRIACVEGMASEFMPELIHRFRQHYPGIHFELYVHNPFLVTKRVQEGECDLGLTLTLTPAKDVMVEKEMTAGIHAVMAPTHPLAQRATVTLKELQGYPLALPSTDTTMRQLFDISSGVQQLVFRSVLVSNNVAALFWFATLEGAITLSGEFSLRGRIARHELVAIPISDEVMQSRRIEVQSMAGRHLPLAVAAFRDFLAAELTG
jgi:DNA-binding transcriptional LysR family regulator